MARSPSHLLPRFVLAAALALGVAGVPLAHAQYREDLPGETSTAIPQQPQIEARTNARIPLDLTFTRSDGKVVKMGDLFNHGRPVILSLVYFSCPALCGFTQKGLVDSVLAGPRNLKLGKDYDIVVVSFDADDTPAKAASERAGYLEMMGRKSDQPGFTYLTGNDRNIEILADTVGFGFRKNPAGDNGNAGKFAHSTGIFVLTPDGRLSQTIRGVSYEPDTLHHALVLASDGKLGSGLLQFALACGACRFDPKTGRYEQNPWFYAGTAGGLACMAGLGIFLGVMWRGEFKKH